MLNYSSYLLLNIPKLIFSIRINKNQLFIHTHKHYMILLSYFVYGEYNSRFQSLIDFTAIDYLGKAKRFCLTYHLISINYHFRLFMRFFLKELESVNTLTYLYPNISWYERECWDLFGIFFNNNLNLRRLLLDYGFVGHPFRKDFPLTGFVELVYSVFYFSVVQRKVNLVQSFRKYESNAVWKL